MWIEEAYAFNPVMLMDPGFIEYMVVTAPMVAAVLMAVWETLFLGLRFKPPSLMTLFLNLVSANVFSMVFAILIFVALVFIVGDTLLQSPQWIAWGGVVYFVGLFFYVAWDAKIKLLLRVTPELTKKAVKKSVFVANTVSFAGFYGFLFWRLF